jgi:DNA (cytosine-5)-methyltransferase 1
VCDDLEAEGYSVGAAVLPACSVGAPHLRDRLWFLADASGQWREPVRRQQLSEGCAQARAVPQWEAEPGVDRMVDGVRNRMALVRGFGNAIVPQVAAEVIRSFLDAEEAA